MFFLEVPLLFITALVYFYILWILVRICFLQEVFEWELVAATVSLMLIFSVVSFLVWAIVRVSF